MAQIENREKKMPLAARNGNPPIRVSILMPAYNAAHTLAAAVASVQAQNLPDWELLIVDDASVDDTHAIACKLADDDARLRIFLHTSNQGAATARNTALAAANGRFIAFLDADDLWSPEKLDQQIAMMQRTGAALSYTGFWRERIGKGRSYQSVVSVPEQVNRQKLLDGNVIGCLTAVYDRHILGDCPMPALDVCEDYALWLDILARIDHAHGLDIPLATRRLQPGSLTANRVRFVHALWHMHRAHFGLDRRAATRFTINHLLRRVSQG